MPRPGNSGRLAITGATVTVALVTALLTQVSEHGAVASASPARPNAHHGSAADAAADAADDPAQHAESVHHSPAVVDHAGDATAAAVAAAVRGGGRLGQLGA